MSDTLPSHVGRGKIFVLSLLFLAACILFVSFLISVKTEPESKSVSVPGYLSVAIRHLEKGDHPIRVEVYGSARAAKTVKLQAPFAGTVTAVSDLYLSKKLDPGEALFNVEKVKLDLDIQDLHVQLKELEIERQRLSREDEILRARIQTAKELFELSGAAVAKEEQRLSIQAELFNNFKELYAGETISYNEYLQAEADLRQEELAVLNAKTNRDSRKDSLEQLEQSLNTNEKALANIDNRKRILEIKIDETKNDLQKAQVDVDFAAQIVELFIDREQEVTAGTPLATVRSIDVSQVQVDVPDAYFRWLYQGDLLNQANGSLDWDELITIELVNRDFPKQFKGGYLKAIGESVTVPSRSLPILIERRNPLNEEGQAIPQEALRPGMYCKITLNLDQVADTFLIPPSALQTDGSILYAIPGDKEEDDWTMGILSEVEVIHEGFDGTLVKVSEELSELWVINDSVRAPREGAPLKVTVVD